MIKNALEYWFEQECYFYDRKKMKPDISIVAAEAWAILETAVAEGSISWNDQRKLFGEFMSKYLNLRV